MNSKYLRWIVPIIGVIFGGLLIEWVAQPSEPFEPTQHYEVQLADELYYTNSEIQAWVDEFKEEAGTQTKKIGDYQYLLVCAGAQTGKESALALVDTISSKKTLEVVYSLVGTTSEAGDTKYPFMLVRIPSKSAPKLVGKEIAEGSISNYFSQK